MRFTGLILLVALFVSLVLPLGVPTAPGERESAIGSIDLCHQGSMLLTGSSMPSLTEPLGTLSAINAAGAIIPADTVISDTLFARTQDRPPRS